MSSDTQQKKSRPFRKYVRKPLYFVWTFLTGWLTTRKFRKFAAGIPALVVTAGILFLVIRNQNVDKETVIENYRKASRAAMQIGNYGQAEVLLKRLLTLQPNEPSTKYQLAMCSEEQGNLSRAYSMMNQIAPANGSGFAPAHFWLAEKHIGGNPARLSDPGSQRVIKNHLNASAKDPKLSNASNFYLSQLYVAQGDFKKAIAAYEKISQRGPTYFQTLSRMYVTAGDLERAENAARAGLRDLQQRIKKTPESRQLYFMAAQTAVALKEFEQGIQLLKSGMQLSAKELAKNQKQLQKEKESAGKEKLEKEKDILISEHRRFMEAIAIAYAAWFDATPQDDLDSRLSRIDQAIQYGPNVSFVVTRLAKLSTEIDTDSERFASLHAAIANGTASGAAHSILGTHALENDEFLKAEQHFRMAVSHQPYAAKTLNNLAWCLSHKENPNLEEAKQFATRAIQLAPNDFRIIDTRAIIHVLMDDKNAAIRDYEQILKLKPDHLETCRQLAKLYAQIGLSDLANQFETRVKKLSDKGDS